MPLGDDGEPRQRDVLGVLNEEIQDRLHARVLLTEQILCKLSLWAVTRRRKRDGDVGESIEDVSCFFDHRSPAVTTTYLRRLEGQEDRSWGRVGGGAWRVAVDAIAARSRPSLG